MAENKTNRKLSPADRVKKAPTPGHKHFAKWVQEQTGYSPESATAEEFEKIVQLTVTLWGAFQASDENKQRHEAEAAEREAAKAARLQERADKLQKQLEAAKAAASKGSKPATKSTKTKAASK